MLINNTRDYFLNFIIYILSDYLRNNIAIGMSL